MGIGNIYTKMNVERYMTIVPYLEAVWCTLIHYLFLSYCFLFRHFFTLSEDAASKPSSATKRSIQLPFLRTVVTPNLRSR